MILLYLNIVFPEATESDVNATLAISANTVTVNGETVDLTAANLQIPSVYEAVKGKLIQMVVSFVFLHPIVLDLQCICHQASLNDKSESFQNFDQIRKFTFNN